jgi:hypothetical protein
MTGLPARCNFFPANWPPEFGGKAGPLSRSKCLPGRLPRTIEQRKRLVCSDKSCSESL